MSQPEFKIGDRVRCVDRYPEDLPQLGDTGVVMELSWPCGVLVAWEGMTNAHADSDQHGTHRTDLWWMRDVELELVS